jgi:amino acid permease
MRLNEKQQDLLSDKLGDFGNLIGTGVVVLSFFTARVGWLPVIAGRAICIVCCAYVLYLGR